MNNINYANLITSLNTPTYTNYDAITFLSGVIGTVATSILGAFSENYANFINYGADLAAPSINAVLYNGSEPAFAGLIVVTTLVIWTIAFAALTTYGIIYATAVTYPNLCKSRMAHEFSVKHVNNTPISVQDIVRAMKLAPFNGSLLDRIDPNGLTKDEIMSLMHVCNSKNSISQFLSKLQQSSFSSDDLIKIMMKYDDSRITTTLLKFIDPNTLSEQQWKKLRAIITKQGPDTRALVAHLNDDSIGYDIAQILISPFTYQTLIKKIDRSRLNEQQHADIVMLASNTNSAKTYFEKIDFFNLPLQQIEKILNAIYRHPFLPNTRYSRIFSTCTNPKMLCIIQRVIGVEQVRGAVVNMPHDAATSKILNLPSRCRNPEELQSMVYSEYLTPSSTLEERIWCLAAIRMQFQGKPEMQHAVDQCLLLQLGSDGYPNGEVKVGDETVAIDLIALQTRSRLLSENPFSEDPFSWKQDLQAQAIAGILQSHSNQISDWIWNNNSPAPLEANPNWVELKHNVKEIHRQMLEDAKALSEMMFHKEAAILHEAAKQMKSDISTLLQPGRLANEYNQLKQALEKNKSYIDWKQRRDIQSTIYTLLYVSNTLGSKYGSHHVDHRFIRTLMNLNGREYTEWESLRSYFKNWLEHVEKEDERTILTNAIRHIERCHINKSWFDKQFRDIVIRIDHPPTLPNIANQLAVIAEELETCNRQPQLIEEPLQFPEIPGIKEYLTFISGVSVDTSPENLVLITRGADYFDDAELMPLLEIYLGRNIDALLSQAPEDAPFEANDDATTLWDRIRSFLNPHPTLPATDHPLNASQIKDPLKPWVPGIFAYAAPKQNATRAKGSSSAAASSSSGASSSSASSSSSSSAAASSSSSASSSSAAASSSSSASSSSAAASSSSSASSSSAAASSSVALTKGV